MAVRDGDGMQSGRINEAEQRASGDDGGRQVGDTDERAFSGGASDQCVEDGKHSRNRVGTDHDARWGIWLFEHECKRSTWLDGM
jgi:hypothetical protein